MTNNIVPIDHSQSPFDAIRRYRADGSEFWEARELMSLMGYPRWEKFKNPLNAAIENLELNGDIVANHFSPLMVKSSGRDASSYELTRYAAYMTALCCDGRKPEVAAAKKYFATKTREAEVVIPAQNDRLRELELINENMRLEIQRMDRMSSMTALHGVPTTLCLMGRDNAIVEVEKPTIEVIDDRHNQQTKYSGQTCTQLKDYMKKRFGITFKSGADVQRVLEEIENKFGVSLLAELPRTVTTTYIPDEHTSKAIEYLRDVKNWQMLLGK
jgi:DNA-damage-inducible protein D